MRALVLPSLNFASPFAIVSTERIEKGGHLMSKAKKAVPDGYRTITPTLTLDDASRAIDWYKKALGAEELSRSTGPDGKIMHAELKIGDSRIMLNDPVMGNKGPKALGGSPTSLWVFVEDCDAFFNR